MKVSHRRLLSGTAWVALTLGCLVVGGMFAETRPAPKAIVEQTDTGTVRLEITIHLQPGANQYSAWPGMTYAVPSLASDSGRVAAIEVKQTGMRP